ncbi:hypothetical protein [Streptomyces sp. NPDC000188]|uniref:hypothetical protein n=1 Tax=Streptomyces sp. NPDC000188 TaxID=3154245 RepID=UPI00131E17D5
MSSGTEAAAEGSGPIPAEPLEAWQRTVPQARAPLGGLDVTQYEQESCDLCHSGTSRCASLAKPRSTQLRPWSGYRPVAPVPLK